MYCEEIDNKYISLAWKLGLHPSTLARLSSITSNSTTWRTITGNGLVGALKLIQICSLLACGSSEQSCTHSINHMSCSSIPYCSYFQN